MTADLPREHVLIVGGSFSGLIAALAFHARNFRVTIVEADPAPDDAIAFEDAASWRRKGAPHAPQPHFFSGRLRKMLRDWYPELASDLLDAGVREMNLETGLHPLARERYKFEPGDEDVATLQARRATIELAIRRYVSRKEIATFVTGATVDALLMDGEKAPYVVTGVRVGKGEEAKDIHADVVVDATGRGSRFPKQLEKAGLDLSEETYDSPSAYYTRMYRLLPGQDFPEIGGIAGSMYPDFVVVTFPADNRYFTVALVVYKDDPILYGTALQKSAVFEKVCRTTARGRQWTDPSVGEPVSNVMAWANMDFLWRTTIADGKPQILNFFFAGDAAIRSNPRYGRGCTWSTMGSALLADILVQTPDPAERALRFDAGLREMFRKDWETMLTVDKADTARFEVAAGLRPSTIKSRLEAAFQSHINHAAIVLDPKVSRAMTRSYYGLDKPTAWMSRPGIWLRIAALLVPGPRRRRIVKQNKYRPSRSELRSIVDTARPLN